jgi:hypothetical protein
LYWNPKCENNTDYFTRAQIFNTIQYINTQDEASLTVSARSGQNTVSLILSILALIASLAYQWEAGRKVNTLATSSILFAIVLFPITKIRQSLNNNVDIERRMSQLGALD